MNEHTASMVNCTANMLYADRLRYDLSIQLQCASWLPAALLPPAQDYTGFVLTRVLAGLLQAVLCSVS